MDKRTTILVIALFALIIGGMLLFALLQGAQ